MAGGKRGDDFLSQPMPAIVMEVTPELQAKFDAQADAQTEAEHEKLRAAAREKDELTALEVRLLHNTLRRQSRDMSKMVDTLREIANASTDASTDAVRTDAALLEAVRENRDAIQLITQTVTIETPQLLKQLLDVAIEIKEFASTIATAIALKTTNGHGETA